MSKKIARKDLVAAADEMGIKVTIKGKPVSNEKLLELVEENMDDHADEDGKFEIEVLADIAAAREDEKDIVVTGDDPTQPSKGKSKAPEKAAEKPAKAKAKKPAKEEDDDDDDEEDEKPAKAKAKKSKPAKDDDDEDEAPAKKAKAKKAAAAEKPAKGDANLDKWGSREGSSAYDINQILFKASSPKKALTVAEIHAKVCEVRDDVSKDRINGHLRRLWKISELIERDDKGRYYVKSA